MTANQISVLPLVFRYTSIVEAPEFMIATKEMTLRGTFPALNYAASVHPRSLEYGNALLPFPPLRPGT
jgi:hypothetical protein